MWVLTFIEIQSKEVMIAHAQECSLTIEEIWAYEGSLKWWKNVYVTTIIPLIGILTTSGIVVIVTPSLLQLKQNVFFKRVRNKSGTLTLDRFLQSKED